jgi:sulfite exporter TauE/SafE
MDAELAAAWGAICGFAAPGPIAGGVVLSLFAAGMVGSLFHCLGMCGPFVLAQIAARLDGRPAEGFGECARFGQATLVTYHLGRITTYAGLGALVGGLGAAATTLAGFAWLPSLVIALAALMFAAEATTRLGAWAASAGVAGGLAGRLIRRNPGATGYGLGLALGFLPCGLIYAGLIAAAGSGSALTGGLAMAALALGTAPMLIMVGYLGLAAGRRWLLLARRLGPILMLANAAGLAVLAVHAWP